MLTAAIFHHSDARLPPAIERPLSRLIVTPSIHWVHHHARRADTDSNYGTVFSFWDPLFRSRSRTRARPGCRSASRVRATGRCSRLLAPRSRRQAGTNGGDALGPPVDQGQDHRPAGQEDQEGQPQAVIAQGRHQHGGGEPRTGPAHAAMPLRSSAVRVAPKIDAVEHERPDRDQGQGHDVGQEGHRLLAHLGQPGHQPHARAAEQRRTPGSSGRRAGRRWRSSPARRRESPAGRGHPRCGRPWPRRRGRSRRARRRRR